ncbi:serine/threonine protein kinase [Microbulbifer flavimaris]|uniref:Serine/threonine protein kinase n=1 Tax=Microbulbifer flavimaris TaxID=1781068 RepID=A0ABX4I5X2_9GAMM|nr:MULTISPECIES: serine/threonine protein kinase [Microbulbifer]KUJ84821.1 serine/threonine protein kinase [Microbulbifer sp. ZGT114]PCO06919.1 serine/threonine protein kinase [Microbulbifer flavimaris]
MKHVNSKLLLSAAIAALLAGCDSGGINIEPETIDNSVDNSVVGGGNSEDNPCASYEKSGQVQQGSFDGTNCTYAASFVDSGNALTQDLFIPALENDGVHIFEGSLFVGNNYDDDATMAAAGIAEGGDGAKLTIEAGSTIAFPNNTKFIVINRGSQLFAVGTPDAPITFTSTSDAIDNAVAFDAVQQWGGMVINGFGITNKCSYDANLQTSECHILAEGAAGKDQSNYGGDNNADNSGQLEYVRVKHTGAQVASGDELNGITFSSVGSGTIVKNLQVYSTYDDGIEMFGGAVSFENYLAMYVRDDSIDIDEGWAGSITNALVIQSETDGNHCIESDGIGSYDDKDAAFIDGVISQGINSRPVIDGLTCIISANGADTATHDPGAGWRFREAIFPKITNSMVVGSFSADTTGVDGSNYCLRVEDPETLVEAEVGTELQIESNIFACEDRTKGGPVGTQTLEEWAVANGNVFADITGAVDPTAMANTELQILEGVPSVFSIDAASMQVNGAAIGISPIERAYFGALSQGDLDWTLGWTYGLHNGEALWFAN